MGHVRKRGEHQYQARWIDDAGHEQVKAFARRRDAEKHITRMENAKITGAYIDQSNPTTVEEAAQAWVEARAGSYRDSTQKRYLSIVRQHIAGTPLGARRLVAVRTSEVQAWVSERTRRLSPATTRLVVQILRGVFNAAVVDRQIPFSPAAKLSLPQLPDKRIIPLTVPQVMALAGAMPAHCKAMAITQGALGLRLGELLALRKQDVNFTFHAVRVQDQLTQSGKDRVDPKTPKSRRTVPMPEVAAEALRRHMVNFSPAEDGLIFTVNGIAWRQDQYDRVLRRAIREAELPAGTTSHALRHHYVSVLLHARVSVVEVAERIGDTPERVLRTYAHMMPDSEDRTRRAVDAAWTVDGQETVNGRS
jgi:integrase